MHKKNLVNSGYICVQVRQLRRLGFTPVVIPYSSLGSPEDCTRALIDILRLNSVSLPNLDDGYLEKTKKF